MPEHSPAPDWLPGPGDETVLCLFDQLVSWLTAAEVAAIYKARWQIELFFKWVKQHLKIKSFLGTTANAVMTQVWVALCVYLLVAYARPTFRPGGHRAHCTKIFKPRSRIRFDILRVPLGSGAEVSAWECSHRGP